MTKKSMLVILDGWGKGKGDNSDAIAQADTPFIDSLYSYPNALIETSGACVGLPDGQMGNSEVGHLNLGAGRIVYQDFVRINLAVQDNSLALNEQLLKALKYARCNDKSVHLIGLVSDGGVHSHTSHLVKLCEIAQNENLKKVYIHALTDGRDTDPRSGYGFIQNLLKQIEGMQAKIATLTGRYYTMDRDKRWERIKKGYDAMVHAIGRKHINVLQAINDSYKENITDEFIEPVVFVDENNQPLTKIQKGDVVICFNFRTDRLRQITTALTQQDFPDHDMKKIDLYYLTMTRYDENFKNVHVLFEKQDLTMTLGEVLEKTGKSQLRIAETEKYAHVTFFFSGGRENEFEDESRVLIPSPKVATYDLQPCMSAPEVAQAVVKQINDKQPDFICLNFANADMVGHTGVYPAIIEALETVDKCMQSVVNEAINNGYSVLITADHGNSDFAVNFDGSPNTAHSLNPVPIILIDKDYKNIQNGKLCDIAPTILKIMNIPIPEEMTGSPLVF